MSSALQKSIYLNRHCAGMLMTPEEFDAIERYGRNYRYELIRGVLVVLPFAGVEEVDATEQLVFLLYRYSETHPNGRLLDATLTRRYVHGAEGRRLIDLAVWIGMGRLPRPDKEPPVIAVEFVTKARNKRLGDYEVKSDEFMTAGVKEYWVVNRFRRTLTVWCADGETVVILEQQDYCPPLLPGFVLPLAKLLAVADRWDR